MAEPAVTNSHHIRSVRTVSAVPVYTDRVVDGSPSFMQELRSVPGVRPHQLFKKRLIFVLSAGVRYGIMSSLLVTVLLGGCSQPSTVRDIYNYEIPKTLLLSREQVLETLIDLEQVRLNIKKDPKDAQLHYQAGLLEERLERWDNALRDFQMALTRNSKLTEAYYHSGLAAEKIGESYELDPTPTVQAEGRTVKGPMRRYALDMYKQAVKLKPNYTDAIHRLGLAYILSNDLPRALATYHRLKELEPRTNRTEELLSRVYDLQRAQYQKN